MTCMPSMCCRESDGVNVGTPRTARALKANLTHPRECSKLPHTPQIIGFLELVTPSVFAAPHIGISAVVDSSFFCFLKLYRKPITVCLMAASSHLSRFSAPGRLHGPVWIEARGSVQTGAQNLCECVDTRQTCPFHLQMADHRAGRPRQLMIVDPCYR